MARIHGWLLAVLSCIAFAGCGNDSKPVQNAVPASSGDAPLPPIDPLQPVREFAERLRETRQKAIETAQPMGLRFVASADAPLLADKYRAVAAAEGFSKGWVEGEKGASFVVGYEGGRKNQFPNVEPDDLLELTQEPGKVYRILGVKAERLELAEALQASVKASPKEPNYTVHRQPRPIDGAKPVSFPPDWVIDLTPPEGMGLTRLVGDAVVFAPDGALLAAEPDSTAIWMRRAKVEGVEALIVIQPRTGSITVHPVNRDPNVGNGDPLHHALPKTTNGSMP